MSEETGERLTLKQFSEKMGIFPSQVTNAVKTGKITPHFDERGHKYLYFAEAKEQWENNRDMSKVASVQHRYRKPKEIPVADLPNIMESKKKRDHYLAEQERIAYELLNGSVLKADDVKKKWGDLIAIVRTKILAVPSKFRQRDPDFTHEKYLILENLIRESLEELSDGKY